MIRKYYLCKINTEGGRLQGWFIQQLKNIGTLFPSHGSYILDGGFLLKLTGKQIQQCWASHLYKMFRRKVFSSHGTLSSEETCPHFLLPDFPSSHLISVKNPFLNQIQLKENPFPLPVRHTLMLRIVLVLLTSGLRL